uniref:TAF5-like RNA polymerase II, p300/CBP-associated factor (PCAF)-associated factor n=1 Tax=Petromyzon marinus TaxID=7757 RepID=S4REI8_PETMA
MKRVRSEQLQSAVNQLLKRRHYTESELAQRQSFRGSQSAEEMAASMAAQLESGPMNAVSFGVYEPNPSHYDRQFNALRQFVNAELRGEERVELQTLMSALSLALCVELALGGWRSAAEAFHGRHVGPVAHTHEQRLLAERLGAALSRQDVGSDTCVRTLTEHKLCVELGVVAHGRLMRHLLQGEHGLLLRAVSTHLRLDVRAQARSSAAGLELYSDGTGGSGGGGASARKMNALPPDEVSLELLQDSIRRVREGPLNAATVCLYGFKSVPAPPCAAEVAPGMGMLAAGYEDSRVMLWSLGPRKLRTARHNVDVARINLACDILDDKVVEDSKGSDVKTLRAHSGPVYAVRFLPGGAGLLSCSEDASVRFWDPRTFTNTAVYQGHAYPVWDVDVSALGLYFCSGSHDRTARLWVPERAFPLRVYAGHVSDVNVVRFHPNGSYVATGSADRTVRLWSAQQGSAARLFTGHRGAVLALAFSPGGRLLASGGEDQRVRLWDIGSGAIVKELRGHSDDITCLSFSPDGSALASGSSDGSVRVWDVRGASTNPGGGGGGSGTGGGGTGGGGGTLNVQFMASNLLLVSAVTRDEPAG